MAGFYDVGKLVATLGMNTSPFMAGANAAQNKMRQMQNSMMMVGRATTRFITLPMAIAGGAAVKAQKDFENSMTKIIGLVGISRKTVEGWKQEIFDISRETGRGPRELGDALYFVTSAGFRGSEALDILHKSAQAAAGGLGETKDVADLVTSAMYAYAKSNLTATEALDAVIATVREGKVEVTDLINSMGKVFPIASKFGVSINEVGASLAAMTRSGTEADKASTHLRAILNQMMSPSSMVRKNLAGLAMGADEFQKVLMEQGLIEALTQLNTAIKGDPKHYAEIFQNIRALTGVLDIMGDNMNENIRIFERMKGASGELKKLFAEVQETTQFKLDKSLANLGITLIELGEILKDPVIALLEKFTGWIQKVSDWLGSMTEQQKKATLQLLAFVAALGPALLILSRVAMMLAAVTGNIPALILMLGTAGFAWARYNKTVRSGTAEQKLRGEAQKNTMALMQIEKEKMGNLLTVVKAEATSKEERTKAIKEMQRIYPSYFSNLDTEKSKVTDVMDAYEEWETGMQLKADVQGIVLAMKTLRENVNAEEEGMLEDSKRIAKERFTAGEKAGVRWQTFLKNREQEIVDAYKPWKSTRLTYQDEIQKKLLGGLEEEREAYSLLAIDLEKAYKAYSVWQNLRLADKGEKPVTPEEVVPEVGVGGYLYNLQKNIKDAQEAALGATQAAFPAAMKLVHAEEQKLKLAMLVGDEYSEQTRAQKDISKLTILQETAGNRLWHIYEGMKMAIGKAAAYLKLQEGGLGAIEKIGWSIAEAEEKLANAAEAERDAIKETLALLREKEAILNETIDQYAEAQLLAGTGSKAWKKHYAERIADLKSWLEAGRGTHQQQMAWRQEIHDKEADIHQNKLNQVADIFQSTADLIGAISSMQEASRLKEIQGANGNEKAIEAINKKYYEKQKKWSIAQAIINGAMAVTNILAHVPGGGINPLAWVAIGITAASVAAQIAVISAQSFAQGGLVYGETIAKVGDYPGASSNPEVIAPLSDLKKLIKPMGTGTMPKYIKLVAEGPDLVATIDTELLMRNTY